MRLKLIKAATLTTTLITFGTLAGTASGAVYLNLESSGTEFYVNPGDPITFQVTMSDPFSEGNHLFMFDLNIRSELQHLFAPAGGEFSTPLITVADFTPLVPPSGGIGSLQMTGGSIIGPGPEIGSLPPLSIGFFEYIVPMDAEHPIVILIDNNNSSVFVSDVTGSSVSPTPILGSNVVTLLINAPTIPEPTSALLLDLGSLGLLRRRRQA